MSRPLVTPRRRRAALVLVPAALLAACGPMRRGGRNEPAATIVFSNQSLTQAAVYAAPRGGMQVRIGTVPPGRTESLRLYEGSLGGAGAVAIVVRLLGVDLPVSTGALNINRGDRLAVTLTSDGRQLMVLPAPDGD